jgi:hypothetical protein
MNNVRYMCNNDRDLFIINIFMYSRYINFYGTRDVVKLLNGYYEKQNNYEIIYLKRLSAAREDALRM